jgi:septum formation protein
VLASRSPRRADLLRAAGYAFRVRLPTVDEVARRGETPAEHSKRIAREKALDVASRARAADSCVILAADTVVTLGGRILGKPSDGDEARRMLEALSGRTHRVATGVAVRIGGRDRLVSDHSITMVTFRKLSARDIAWYIATGDPLDKAGAYGIQGPAGLFVTSIRGSYSNVVGLPMDLVYRLIGPPG